MPIYYTTRDRAKAESKGHRFEQDYNVFCSSDQEHKPLWQFSYAHGLVVGIEELADPEDPDQETQSSAILFDIVTNGIERRQYASSRIPSIGCQAVVDASPEILERYRSVKEQLQGQRVAELRKAFVGELATKGVEKVLAERFFDRSAMLGEPLTEACSSLLKTQQFRSEFRRSLRDQLVRWIRDEKPRYPSPFSSRQIDCLMRFGR